MTTRVCVTFVSLCLCVLLGAVRGEAATCSGSSCTGQNPFVTGCSSDAYAAASSFILDSYGSRLGTTSLLWSPTCGAGYTVIQLDSSYSSASFVSAGIHAGYPQIYDSRNGWTSNSTTAVSPMLSADLSQLTACGTIRIPRLSIRDSEGEPTGALEGDSCAR